MIHKLYPLEVPTPHQTVRHSRLYINLLNSDDWAMEPLRPGLRAFAINDRNGARLVWSNGECIKHPSCANLVKDLKLPINTILDGVVSLNNGPFLRIFDVPMYSGASLKSLEYSRRRKVIRKLVCNIHSVIVPSSSDRTTKSYVFADLLPTDRGVIFKHRRAPYPVGHGIERRTGDWIACNFEPELQNAT
jgi:hypothetical protein